MTEMLARRLADRRSVLIERIARASRFSPRQTSMCSASLNLLKKPHSVMRNVSSTI
jgi:hypothetical protein